MKVKVLVKDGGYILEHPDMSLKGKVFTAYPCPEGSDVVYLDFAELKPYFGVDPREEDSTWLDDDLGWTFFTDEVEILE